MSALPKDSLVLVTGGNGWIASGIIDELIQLGYRARGTVREEAKAAWLKEYVNDKYGPGKLEIAIVPDMSVTSSFDEAVKGVSAFIHVASDLSFSSDPDVVIPITVKGAEAALAAAKKEPLIKHFVYTSSIAVAKTLQTDVKIDVYADTWHHEALELARRPGPMQAVYVYAAAKMLAEQAVLRAATSEDDLPFTVNTVVPNFNLGPLMAPGRQKASSGDLLPAFYERGWEGLGTFGQMLGPQHYVDARDTARLHVAPLLDPTIQNERLFAAVAGFNWNDVVDVFAELRGASSSGATMLPAHADDDDRCDLHVIHPTARALEVLNKTFGQDRFVSFKESVRANIQHLL